jgi:hypothetical protein
MDYYERKKQLDHPVKTSDANLGLKGKFREGLKSLNVPILFINSLLNCFKTTNRITWIHLGWKVTIEILLKR